MTLGLGVTWFRVYMSLHDWLVVQELSKICSLQGAMTLGLAVSEYLSLVKAAGLGSLPGTAAEVLDDEVRDLLCPDKLNTEEWLQVRKGADGWCCCCCRW
jgi:2-iminoacetate synthase ThiH